MNLASGREIKIGRLAEMVNRLTGSDAGIKIVGSRKWDTKKRLLASIDLARETMGYDPKMDFEEGIKITIEWFKNHMADIDASNSFGPGTSSAVRELGALGKTKE